MKKAFTLIMMTLLLVGVNAQNYRKWDFTSWGNATVTNLANEAAKGVSGGYWSDIEKSTGTAPTELSANNCFWEVAAQGSKEGKAVMANAESAIPELDGLLYVNTTNRSLAIAVNYQVANASDAAFGPYHGPSYLWLGSSKKNYFVIPNVKPGQSIKMGVESHKTSDARGVELYIYKSDYTLGEKLTDPDGNEVAMPKTYTDMEWVVPANAEGQNAEGNYDILIYNTNGCHLYYIEVGTADQKSKIAYLYQGETDGVLAVAQSMANYDVESIDVASATVTAEQLKAYDAIILATNIAADNAAVAAVKDAISWTPVVNTNAALYAAWGYGAPVASELPFIQLKDRSNKLFSNIEAITEDEVVYAIPVAEAGYTGVQLAGYFANDAVPAVLMGNEEVAAAHIHNNGHNSYVYVPFSASVSDEGKQLLANAISMAANTKADITDTQAPTFTFDYQNMKTLVSIKCANAGAAIYYTLDGSEPTEGSTLYTEPIEVSTEGVTVKAVAIADGYTLSAVAAKTVDLKQQAAAPSISAEQGDKQTAVTITGEGTLWYNYSGKTDTLASTKYTAPVVLTFPRTVYAFASDEGKVNSEAVSLAVGINNFSPRIDIIGHMDANSAEYNGGSTSTAYYFSWGKNKSGENGYYYYNVDAGYTEETTTDPETGDETTVKKYSEMNPEEYKDFENGWMVRSRGQLTIWENQTTGTSYGNTGGYNYATVDDENPYFPATKAYINLADKNTLPSDATFPYNSYIVSTKKFQGPFDIVVNMASITKPENASKHQVVLQVATDGNVWESGWQTVGDTIVVDNSARLTHNITRSYESSDEVYVRAYLCGDNSKVGFYDIYIANYGEKSQELITGITEQKAASVQKTAAVYNLNGVRQQGMKRGLNIVVDAQGQARKVLVK